MTVYLDSLFILNWIVNYLLLLVTAKVAGEPFHRVRMGVGGAVGALFAALAFFPAGAWLLNPVCKIAVSAGMVLTAFGGSRHLLRVGGIFAGLSCALSGGLLLVGQVGGKALSMRHGILTTDMDLKTVLLAAVLCYCFLTVLFRRSGQHGKAELEPAVVSLGGESVLLTALHDTGNTLADPATGRPVLVVEGERLKKLFPENLLKMLTDPAGAMERFAEEPWGRRLRLLPYRAVGIDCGFLLAVRCDKVSVGGKDYGGLLVALSPTSVSDGGGYQALFGGG